MAQVNRQQTAESESQLNTRQDRNTFLTDGGTWTWDQGTGTLAWSGSARLCRGGVAVGVITTGSVTGLTTAGDVAYVDVSRTAGGALTVLAAGVSITDTANATDTRVILGVRGTDGKFYFRNGTVMSDGDSKLFGQLNTVTDRNDIVSTGVALNAVGFTYVTGSNQLAVYVGGILQILGVHYTETSSTQITFTAGFIPSAGERISFVNIIGGEGPAATGTVSLQDAWATGNAIDVSSGTGIVITSASTGQSQLLGQHDPGGGPTLKWVIGADGSFQSVGGESGFTVRGNDLSANWGLLPLDDGGGSLLLFNGGGSGDGFRITPTGRVEFGAYSGSYPGGSWSGGGGTKWLVRSGTTSGAGATVVAVGTGLNVQGIALAVQDGTTGRWILLESSTGLTANKNFAVVYDSSAGNVIISDQVGGASAPGSDITSQAYRFILFYQ